MQEVDEFTAGSTRLGPGTLYRSIQRMLVDGLIEELAIAAHDESDDDRRRYYRLTPKGLATAKGEAQRDRQPGRRRAAAQAAREIHDERDAPTPERSRGRPWLARVPEDFHTITPQLRDRGRAASPAQSTGTPRRSARTSCCGTRRPTAGSCTPSCCSATRGSSSWTSSPARCQSPRALGGTPVTLHLYVARRGRAVRARRRRRRHGADAGRRPVLGRSLRDAHRPLRPPLVDRQPHRGPLPHGPARSGPRAGARARSTHDTRDAPPSRPSSPSWSPTCCGGDSRDHPQRRLRAVREARCCAPPATGTPPWQMLFLPVVHLRGDRVARLGARTTARLDGQGSTLARGLKLGLLGGRSAAAGLAALVRRAAVARRSRAEAARARAASSSLVDRRDESPPWPRVAARGPSRRA